MTEKRQILKADGIKPDSEFTEFEYVNSKVNVLQKELKLIQKILKQNNLVYKVEEIADTDLENETWNSLENL